MRANWTRCSGRTSTLAPTSSTTHVPRRRRQVAGERGPQHARQAAEPEEGRRHDGPGVAGRGEAVGAAGLDEPDAAVDGRVGLLLERHARALAHLDDLRARRRRRRRRRAAPQRSSSARISASRPTSTTRKRSAPCGAAASAPSTTTPGAWSPPMASTATRTRPAGGIVDIGGTAGGWGGARYGAPSQRPSRTGAAAPRAQTDGARRAPRQARRGHRRSRGRRGRPWAGRSRPRALGVLLDDAHGAAAVVAAGRAGAVHELVGPAVRALLRHGQGADLVGLGAARARAGFGGTALGVSHRKRSETPAERAGEVRRPGGSLSERSSSGAPSPAARVAEGGEGGPAGCRSPRPRPARRRRSGGRAPRRPG